jgi:sirohydrochlorin cobaltochelatase
MLQKSDSALLVVGHGSTVNPDSSTPTFEHAGEIRRRGVFADVQCAFWKEEPSLRDALFLFDVDLAREVYVVPNFISEGYFTQTVIPRELELNGRFTRRGSGQVWNYCEPVGSHPMMTDLLLQRARDVAPAVEGSETTLLIVAHGTDLNENSAVAAKREAQKIRELGLYAEVLNVYMEEPPRVEDWQKLTSTPNVVVVPFFISDGLHSYEDIPVLLGIIAGHPEQSGAESKDREVEQAAPGTWPSSLDSARDDRGWSKGEVFRKNPYKLDNRSLFYASSIGTDARIADVILAQAEAFDRAELHASGSS